MTTALCLRCGATKFGAFGRCGACGGPALDDQPLAIALSTHVLSGVALERLGGLVRAIAAATPDGDLRRAALMTFLHDRMPSQFHRDVPAALVGPARGLLAQLALPAVLAPTTPPPRPRTPPLPHAPVRRDLFWEQILIEARRNPALALVGVPLADAPDLVVVDGVVRAVDDRGAVTVVEDGSELDRRRAQHVVDQIASRHADLEIIGTTIERVQRHFVRGEAPRPVHLPFAMLLERVAASTRVICPHRVAAYLYVARLACGDRTFALRELVERVDVAPSRRARVHIAG